MKAILIRTTGGPSVLEHVDLPDPVAGPGEVLVRAAAIGVNRPDVLIRKGEYPWMPPLPTIPGIELAGIVEAVGASVRTLKPGDRVAVSARDLPERGGCYAELIAVPEKAAYAMPAGADVDGAACLANYQVAHLLLTEGACGVPETGSVYVAAASGGIGNALVQLCRQQGRTVVVGVGSAEKAETLQRLGADHVVLTREGDVVAAIRAATGGKGVDLVLDPIGGETLAAMFGAIAPFGLVVSYGRLAGRRQADLYEAMFKFQTACPAFRIFTMHAFDGDNAVRRASMRHLLALLAEGRIAPPIARRFALADAAAAHELMESRTITGNIVLKP